MDRVNRSHSWTGQSGNKLIRPLCWAGLGSVCDDKATTLKTTAEFGARCCVLAKLLQLREAPESTFPGKQLLGGFSSGSFLLPLLCCAVFQAHSAQVIPNEQLGLVAQQAVHNVFLHVVWTANTKRETNSAHHFIAPVACLGMMQS